MRTATLVAALALWAAPAQAQYVTTSYYVAPSGYYYQPYAGSYGYSYGYRSYYGYPSYGYPTLAPYGNFYPGTYTVPPYSSYYPNPAWYSSASYGSYYGGYYGRGYSGRRY